MLDAKGKLQQGLWLMDKMQYALWCYKKNADAVNWYQRDKIAPTLTKQNKKKLKDFIKFLRSHLGIILEDVSN